MTNGEGWRSRLLNDRWFGALPAGLQDALLAAARQRRFTPGKLLFARGDAPCGLYILLEGSVRVGAADEQYPPGHFDEVALPYWFGEVSLFDGLPRTQDLYSSGQSILLQVPQATLLTLLEQYPQYWRSFAELLGHKLGLPLLRADELARLPPRTRIARRLLLLSEGYGELNHSRRLIPFEDLALDDPQLPEILQTLHQRKVVYLRQEQLQVLNINRLREMAGARFVRSKA
ncbi:Crp/Fnr family transcriptional regulator [Pseudomonas sp. Pseusp122]|uniref:Crp/Fnr family transcriptional regulator n=1 Tax=unclassified Pseudomonas TaxID=196821 RepID=UPI0039A6501C